MSKGNRMLAAGWGENKGPAPTEGELARWLDGKPGTLVPVKDGNNLVGWWHSPDGERLLLSVLQTTASFVLTANGVENALELHKTRKLPGKPLKALLNVWLNRPRPLDQRRLLVVQERKPRKGAEPFLVGRQPGVLSLAAMPLKAVEVDGEPFATKRPSCGRTRVRRWTIPTGEQGELFPGPRTLDGKATGGWVVEAISSLDLTGDERNPLRADLIRLANLAFALSGLVELSDTDGALLVGGKDTPANRNRFWSVMACLNGTYLVDHCGAPVNMAIAILDKPRILGPPRWWLDKSGPMGWRLTGNLFLPPSQSGAVERTIGGLEASLAYGPSAGKGKGGRIPDNLRPSRPGGPGTEVFVPWWRVLRLAGEPVTADAPYSGKLGMRYGRRVNLLKAAGHFATRKGTSLEGGTVEVLERKPGGKYRYAGLIIRASARYCAAVVNHEHIRIPAIRLLGTNQEKPRYPEPQTPLP